MCDCCAPIEESRADAAAVCPSCSQKGKMIGTLTVKALLAVSLERVDEGSTYRFCPTPDCPAVYYDEEGGFFTEADLRERVHQKHPDADDVFVCYCYRHTPGSLRADLAGRGRTDVIARITAGTLAGTCACDIRNPQGSCCLGNVRQLVRRIEQQGEPAPF